MRQAPAEGVGQPVHRFFHDPQGFFQLELLADIEDVAEVASFHELHDDEVPAGAVVLAHVEDADDVLVVQGHAQTAFTLEALDPLGGVQPASAKNFDCHDVAVARVVAPVHATETTRGDLVQDAIATQQVTVLFALEQLARLQRREQPLAFEHLGELDRCGSVVVEFVEQLARLAFGDQLAADGQLGQFHRICWFTHSGPVQGSGVVAIRAFRFSFT